MVIFQYNLYIFGIHLWTVLYPKPCYNEPCYKEVEVYADIDEMLLLEKNKGVGVNSFIVIPLCYSCKVDLAWLYRVCMMK